MITCLSLDRRGIAAFVLLLAIAIAPRAAHAGCNLIPQAQPIFRGSLGTLDRPFARPGDFVELHVRSAICDGASVGIGDSVDDLVVTLLFEPANGSSRAVVLTTHACSDAAVAGKLAACGGIVGTGDGAVTCVQMNQNGPVDMQLL